MSPPTILILQSILIPQSIRNPPSIPNLQSIRNPQSSIRNGQSSLFARIIAPIIATSSSIEAISNGIR